MKQPWVVSLLLAFSAIVTHSCTKRSSQDSSARSLSPSDVARIIEGKNEFDQSTRKYFIALYSEQLLSEGGTSVFDAYQSLIRTNIGEGYKTYLLSSHSDESYTQNPNIQHYLIANRADVLRQLDIILAEIKAELQRQDQPKIERVEIIFHLFAHGSTSAGGGDGFFEIVDLNPKASTTKDSTSDVIWNSKPPESFNQRMTWSDLWKLILEPLSAVSTELIAILGPCFSGNAIVHIPRHFTTASSPHNIMVVTSAQSNKVAYSTGQNTGISPATSPKRSLWGYADSLTTLEWLTKSLIIQTFLKSMKIA